MSIIFISLYKAALKTVYDDGVEHSGYMSFMILLALFPFIVFLLALTSFFGASELGEKFVGILVENMPSESIASIKNRITEITKSPPQSLMTIAIIGSIWTASSFLEGIRTILNKIYKVTSPPSYIFRRFLSIIQFLVMSLLISLAMLLLIFIPILLSRVPAFAEIMNNYLPHNLIALNIVRYSLICSSLFLVTLGLYYFIPNIKLTVVEVIPGAILVVVLWIVSGHLLSSYLIYYNQLNIVYGSLGSIIVTLLFFYIINVIFIYGAEFNNILIEEKKRKGYNNKT